MPGGDPSGPLAPAQVAFIESADRITVAAPRARGRPALFELSGHSGMLRLLDGTTIAVALRGEESVDLLPVASGA
ncbi:MAG TPA: hypothetical protein VLT59_18180, partial [Steroidobacteraceae bacterium]|nr:hypothetical protein [Steroidobacteraceae bacterium]